MINKSFGDSDIGEDFSKEQQKHMMTYDKNEEANEESEVVTPEHISEINKVSECFDTDATCLKEPTSVVTNLSIDDIINNMVKDTTEDSVLQEINGVNLSVTDESQFVVQDNEQQELAIQVQSIDTNEPSDLLAANEKQLQTIIQDDVNEQQEVCSQIEPIDINEPSDVSLVKSTIVNEKISNTTEDVTKNLDSEETLSVTNKSQDMQFDAGQIEKQEAQSKAQPNINESLECQILSTTFDGSNICCLPKEHINPVKELQRQSPVEDETAHGSANKNDNLQVTLKSASIDKKTSTKSTDMVVMTPLPSVIKTDTIEQRRPLSSRRRSEDKIVPGCISRGESPDPEAATYSLTPKTSASIANTLQPVADSAREENEILTISVENNIP